MRRRLVLLCLLAPLAGCGSSSGGGSTSTGGGAAKPADQFVSLGCAACHTLKAANAHGDRGPNLDEVKPSVADVEKQVINGGGGMPSFKSTLRPAQIHALAIYVANAAAGE